MYLRISLIILGNALPSSPNCFLLQSMHFPLTLLFASLGSNQVCIRFLHNNNSQVIKHQFFFTTIIVVVEKLGHVIFFAYYALFGEIAQCHFSSNFFQTLHRIIFLTFNAALDLTKYLNTDFNDFGSISTNCRVDVLKFKWMLIYVIAFLFFLWKCESMNM